MWCVPRHRSSSSSSSLYAHSPTEKLFFPTVFPSFPPPFNLTPTERSTCALYESITRTPHAPVLDPGNPPLVMPWKRDSSRSIVVLVTRLKRGHASLAAVPRLARYPALSVSCVLFAGAMGGGERNASRGCDTESDCSSSSRLSSVKGGGARGHY